MSNQSADSRTVATDALATLGTLITPQEKRDAVHLAVVSCIAGSWDLEPGAHVQVNLQGTVAYRCEPGEGVGIVDPFLIERVPEGKSFWLVIYPRKIASLRHVWSHLAFPDEPVAGQVLTSLQISQAWMDAYCKTLGVSPKTLLDRIDDGWDEYFQSGDLDLSGEIPDTFWDHAEVILGRKFPNRATYFTCSC